MIGARFGVVQALVAAGLVAAAGALSAQDPVPAGAQLPDTVEVDSTALRIQQRLQLLGRAPGSDSARAEAYADSLRTLSAPANGFRGRPTQPGVGSEAPTDIYARLRGLEGYTATEYAGTTAAYDADDGQLVLQGDSLVQAAVTFAQGELRAQSIRYIEATGDLDAEGTPIFVPLDGDEINAQGLTWNTTADRGSARQAETQYTQGGNWYITSDFPELTSSRAFGHDAWFTTCEHEVPHYHFRAGQLKIVRGSILVARPVKLYFGDVPVAWLPFIATGLNSGRQSGILTPRFSVNDIVRTSGGYQRRVSNLGFYWAMSDYSDASIALDWFDNNYTALAGTARYNWARKFMRGSLSYRQYWRATGGVERTLNTSHQWQMSERTNLNVQGAYASSSSFVTQNSFDPVEVTRSIDSQGGLQHRFDWGNLSLSGNRRQFLSDDRVEQTFPSVNLSLSTITLFPAPQNRAGILNNITLSGGGTFRRSSTTRADFDTQPDRANTDGSLRAGLTLGRVSVSSGLQYRENALTGFSLGDGGPLLKTDSIDARGDLPGEIATRGAQVFDDPDMRAMLLEGYVDRADIADARLSWNASLNYQQNLIGSTTFTPSISWDSEFLRTDTLSYAQDFVAGPTRVSFGASLRSDLYGFFPGFGKWEGIRHKVSPAFTYSYSPKVEPTALQEAVFGSSVVFPRNTLSMTLNQTFEGRVRSRTPEEAEAGDSTGLSLAGGAGPQRTEDGFLIPEQAETELLLGLQTSALAYDFVADSTGRFVDGFTTASLSNTIRSDYIRGLTVSMRHDLFDESAGTGGGPASKNFSPYLESMNFSYAFSNTSTIFRWLGFGNSAASSGPDERSAEDLEAELRAPASQESIVPDDPGDVGDTGARGRQADVGAWDLTLGYSLIRSRPTATREGNASQNLSVSMRLTPTEDWQMAWRTSYDLENGGFNDHIISLTRDLHRWEANFDFLQTASGNWTFRFEVRLLDQQDLKFDYSQNSIDGIDRSRSVGAR